MERPFSARPPEDLRKRENDALGSRINLVGKAPRVIAAKQLKSGDVVFGLLRLIFGLKVVQDDRPLPWYTGAPQRKQNGPFWTATAHY